MLLEGITPGPLGSIRDQTLRQQWLKKKVREARLSMAVAAASLKNADGAKNLFRDFHDDLLGKAQDKGAREKEMLEYYVTYVKHTRPEMKVVREDGVERLEVTGLKDL